MRKRGVLEAEERWRCLMRRTLRARRFRVHHVGTKLNEAEVRELEALATKHSQTHAELIRGLILRESNKAKRGIGPVRRWWRSRPAGCC
jgi:hypothetical protein